MAENVSVARVTERAVNEKILEVEISGGICYNQDVAGETARMAGGDSKKERNGRLLPSFRLAQLKVYD